jgi:hypothetical protein
VVACGKHKVGAVSQHPTVIGTRSRLEQPLPSLPCGSDVAGADHHLPHAGEARSCGLRLGEALCFGSPSGGHVVPPLADRNELRRQGEQPRTEAP